MAVMGTWPFSAPFSFSLNNSGSRLRVTEISGKPLARAQSAIGFLGFTASRTIGSLAALRISTLTRESLPPPSRTAERRGN